MQKFYQTEKALIYAPEFYLPVLDAKGEPIPLLPPAIKGILGPRLETILGALDGLKVQSALSLLEAASKAVMQCPVQTKE